MGAPRRLDALRLLVLLFLAAAPGCGYLPARGWDLLDVVAPGVSSGSGLGLRAGVTRLVAVEVMAQKDERFFGWRQRNARWTESSYGLPFSVFRMPGLGEETRPERRWYDFFTTSRRRTHYPNREPIEDRRHTLCIYSGGSGERLVDALDVELGASVLGWGLELAVRPGELADFILGWFGLDLAGDDGLGSKAISELPKASTP